MTKRKTALITGVTGQDGSYLAEILLEKGYQVYGMVRRSSTFNRSRIDHLYGQLELVYGDLGDGSSLNQLMRTIRPDEVYNLGAQSHVRVSFDMPEYTADVVALGTLRLLDAIREGDLRCRFYQASSSEMFGKVVEVPQKEMYRVTWVGVDQSPRTVSYRDLAAKGFQFDLIAAFNEP